MYVPFNIERGDKEEMNCDEIKGRQGEKTTDLTVVESFVEAVAVSVA